jgi:hypothetical protein
MYKTHANFHASPFHIFNAAVLSDMMDFFCPFTPTQSLLLYCQLNVGAIMQQASFTSKPTLDNFILLVPPPPKKRRKGMTTLYFSFVVSVNPNPFHSSPFHHIAQRTVQFEDTEPKQ